jgi:hypothetical protein
MERMKTDKKKWAILITLQAVGVKTHFKKHSVFNSE